MQNQNFQEKFDSFLAGVNKIYTDYMDSTFPNNPKEPIVAMAGKRYIRLAHTRDGKPSSCYCFVDTQNGDVLKSASWKAPAKGARGNIYDAHNGLASMNAYGAAYLRG